MPNTSANPDVMLELRDIDLMGRGATIALLTIWGWVLVRDHRAELPARAALAMIATIICHMIADMFPLRGDSSIFLFAAKLGQAMSPTCFWLFSKTWFDDERRISRGTAITLLTALAFAVLTIMLSWRNGVYTLAMDVPLRIFWLGFAAAGLWIAWRGRAGDLVEARRTLRGRFIFVTGSYFLLTTSLGFIANLRDGPSLIFGVVSFGISLVSAALCIAMFGIRQPDLFAAAQRPAERLAELDEAQDDLTANLQAHMKATKAWRDETLTIAGLAQQLGIQEYRLRRLINGHIGHRNFAAFLNSFRLAEVKDALTDPTQRDVPILTIALDAGFGSLGPFNRAFREAEGMTPSQYRAINTPSH
jgi:AraC-like DNA-binding protein